MGKDLDFRENLDLDVFNAVDTILAVENHDEGILYARVDFANEHTRLAAAGDSEAIYSGILSLLEGVDGAFAILLDAVLTYAEDKEIDINTFFDAKVKKPEKKRGRPRKQ